ncbi:PAS domain S-box protein [Niastella caeni]|uniref:histidine kinase n=1 Tax=Niastella caeni TaxID=2569763 RepID=A0A4S8HVF6_9BACT|nr:PAS domain S-box protein [Niastella caeni]THU39658.1 PAS domain S-box protein [Niastella caeni]
MRVHSKAKRSKMPVQGNANNPVLNAVFNALDVGVLIVDHEGYFVDMNDSYCRMIGYERRELVGKHFLTVVPEVQRDFTVKNFKDVMTSSSSSRTLTEFPIQRKDGHIFGANCSVTVINNPDGFRNIVVCITDISEINKYKHLLEETELAAGIGGWQLDVQTNSLSCTEGMYKLLEIPRNKKITWYDMLTFVGKEAYQQFKWAVHQAIQKGTPFNIDLNCCKDYSSKKWIRAIGWPELALNKTIQLFGTFQDITQHKQAEELIYLGQAKYRAIVNSSLYAFILGVPDGTILEANTKACELFGYTEEEFKKIGRQGLVLQTAEFMRLMEERNKKGFVQGEMIGIKKNGEQIPCEFSSICFKDLNGQDRMSTIIRDITAKKRAEEELKKLSLIARETLSPIVITDLDRRIQWVNAAFTRVMEYTLKEVYGKRPEDFLYGKETDKDAIRALQENKRAGRTFDSEMLLYTKSGKKVWITMQAQPQFDSHGRLSGYFAIGIDSTERKKSEELMLRNQKLLLQAERLASLGSWEIDLKTGATMWSDELFRIFGLEPNNFSPTWEQRLEVIHPDDLEYVLGRIQDAIDNKQSFDLEFRCRRPDGSIRIIHSQGELIKNNLGEPVKLIGAAHDITNHKQAEEKLRLQEARMLEEKVNSQRQMARSTINTQEKERSDIGKELHDNVNQILASAKLFLSSPFIEGDEREKFTNKAAEHIHMAIEEIRKLSKSLVSPSAADLGIIETINDMIGDIKLAQKIEVSFNYAGFDESKLDSGLKLTIYRIVQEQMNNILKYANASKIGITLKGQGKKLMLSITDNGRGFDPVLKRKGIGLNNIINRADVFNGKVDIKTAPGEGCVLKVVFEK